MREHRYENLILQNIVLHGIISGSTQKNSSTYKTFSTSRWLLKWFSTNSFIGKKQVVIKSFIHVHFK